jgi:hypothetical protein
MPAEVVETVEERVLGRVSTWKILVGLLRIHCSLPLSFQLDCEFEDSIHAYKEDIPFHHFRHEDGFPSDTYSAPNEHRKQEGVVDSQEARICPPRVGRSSLEIQ